eukprot:2461068-Alexandrium_andersonii.AAC.1
MLVSHSESAESRRPLPLQLWAHCSSGRVAVLGAMQFWARCSSGRVAVLGAGGGPGRDLNIGP